MTEDHRSEDIPTVTMPVADAMMIARHVKAALLHLGTAQDLAGESGVDLNPTMFRSGTPAAVFDAAYNAVQDLDIWTLNNARANGAGAATTAGTERWCHLPGGVLPTIDGSPE